MSNRVRTRPVVQEPVLIPARVLKALIAAIKGHAQACLQGPIQASTETQNVLLKHEAMCDACWHRALTEPWDVSLSEWASSMKMSYKAAYRMYKAGKIPGGYEVDGQIRVCNPNFSAGALSRVQPK